MKRYILSVLIAFAILTAAPTTSWAESACEENLAGTINPYVLEHHLLITTYRALCGASIAGDIGFWESMITHVGCSENTTVTRFMRHHWTGALRNRRPDFNAAMHSDLGHVEEVCRQAGSIVYPRRFSPAGLAALERQLTSRPALHPK